MPVRSRARRGDPSTWPVIRDAATGLHVLEQPDGTTLIYVQRDFPLTDLERQHLRRLYGEKAIIPQSTLANALISVAHEVAEGHDEHELNLAKLIRLAGPEGMQALAALQARLLDQPELLTRPLPEFA